jgi:apolipoprotein N-acyltransferase
MFQVAEMPLGEIAIRFVVCLAAITLASVLYVTALLWIGRTLKGVAKTTLALLAYLLMAAAICAGFLWVLATAEDTHVRQSWGYLGVVIGTWIAAVTPAFFYIGRFKLAELRAVGFFLPNG